MGGQDRTRKQLIEALEEARKRLGELEQSDVDLTATRLALSESERRFQSIYDTANALILAHDDHWQVVYMNPHACKVLGYDPDEMVGRDVRTMLEEAEVDRAEPVREKVVIDPEMRVEGFEQYYLTKGGGRVLLSWNVSALVDADGNAVGILGVGQDITERKRIEDQLRRSQGRFQALAEQTSDWIWEVDETGAYTYCSPKVMDLLGYEPQEVLGKTPFDLMPPEEAARVSALFGPIVEARRPFDGLENTNRHKDGHLVVLETSGVPITNGDGSYVGYRGIDRDITARKEAEKALRQSHDELERRVEERTRELEAANEGLRRSEATYREIFEAATDMIVVQDIETGEVLDINEETCRATGFSRDELFAMGVAGWSPQGEAFAPERAMGYMARAAAGEPQLFEWGFVDSEGKLHPTEVHLKRVTIGGVPRLLGVVRDITERRQVEDALTESERRYRALFENMNECVAVYEAVDDGEDFVFSGFNRAAEAVDRIGREDLLGRRVTEVFPGVAELGLLQVFTEVWRTGEPRHHPVSFYEDERLAGWRENFVYKLPTGEVVAVYSDVTEQRRAEEQLRRSEVEFRTTFEKSNDAIFWGDPETGLLTRCNRAAENLLERPREEIVGQHQTSVHPPDKAERYAQMFRKHIEENGTFEEEAEVITRSGKIKPVAITASIATVAGKPILQGVFRDITERKRWEKRTTDSLREKEVLLSEVHHRVKNNLQVISSLLNLQSRTVGDAAVEEMFRESQNRVRTMALTHEQLYRSEDLARVDLGRYVRDLAGSLFRSYGVDPGIVALRVDVAELSLPLDMAIPCGLIINELVSNCLKHAFADGRRGEIRISLHQDEGGQGTLTVTDDGAGLPGGLDLQATESLGLQLVASLVDQIRGTLAVDRSDGTAFRITFALGGTGD